MPSNRTRESALWGWLRDGVKQLAATGHKCDVQRIENAVATGTPDVEACIDGGQFWAELKVAHEQPTRGTIRIDTTSKQVYRALRRVRAGGRSWYLIRVGTYPKWVHHLIWGGLAEELLDRPIPLDWLALHSAANPRCSAEEIMMAASRLKG